MQVLLNKWQRNSLLVEIIQQHVKKKGECNKLNSIDTVKAKEEIIDNIRDLYSAKITLPLGNPNLKLVHTNQFLFTELPTDVFELANFDEIATALNSSYSRYSGYVINRWYIEGITINNDGSTAKMELDLNPFASNVLKYRDDRKSFIEAYTSATSSNTSTSTNSTTTNSVKSVTSTNTTLDGGEGTTIDNLVKKIVGKITDPMKKAKKIHEWLRVNVSYKYYSCSKYHSAKSCYEHRKQLNCADTARLTRAMMSSAGLTAEVVHGLNHFWTRVKINGKWYASDATSHYRKFNQVWKGLKHYARNGKNPSC